MYVYEKWMAVIGEEQLLRLDPMYVYNTYRICGNHFNDDDNYTNNRLIKDAIPTRNLPPHQDNSLQITTGMEILVFL
nr:unnamed protein product [Callosobruchus analis]